MNARNRLHNHHRHHHRPSSKPGSEDEFAEDELSVGEPSEARMDKNHDVGEFHEGMLLDALLQLYPSVAGKFRI